MRFLLRQSKHSNNFSNVLLVFIIGFQVLVNSVLGHRCFVCGVDEELNCDNFDPHDKIYTKECPPHSKGCSIRTEDKTVERSCENTKLNDCKVANNVKYCYCSANLCNHFPSMLNNNLNNPSDDEDQDDVEGSGVKNNNYPITVTTEPPKRKTNAATTGAMSTLSICANFLYVIIAVLYNI